MSPAKPELDRGEKLVTIYLPIEMGVMTEIMRACRRAQHRDASLDVAMDSDAATVTLYAVRPMAERKVPG